MKQQQMKRAMLAVLVSGMFLPLGVQASEAELISKIEALSKELAALKAQVQAQQVQTKQVADKVEIAESKSIGKWLEIGGDYQLRVDSLRGETKTFLDVNNAFKVMQTNAMMMPGSASPSLAELVMVSEGMKTVGTYQAASGFLTAVQTMTPTQLATLAASGPAGAQQAAGISAAQSLLGYMYPGGVPNTALLVPSYKPKNDTMYTNLFGLDLRAKVAQDVSLTARLEMYKTFGESGADAITNAGYAPFSADRVGVFDGTVGRVPSNSYLNVDRAYANWNNLFDEDIWFSVGRRPSTQGAPSNYRFNTEWPGRGGAPALLVDYAFDGAVLGYGFDNDAMPGGYAKLCYGRGFESGFRWDSGNSLQDTDMIGISFVPIDTGTKRVWLQWNRGMNIFDAPKMQNTYFGNTMPKANLGDIDWFGAGIMGKIKNVGKGDLNYFADFGWSITHPNNNVSSQFGFQGLLTGAFFAPEAPSDKTGGAVYLGVRYDLPSKTKIGFEYNYGSKNWITFAPAAADMWTTKVGTRGNVYEAYVIQELNAAPIASAQAKSFFRLGFQYYDFKYTGSNNWVGAPVKISDVNGQMMTMAPLSKAYDLYGTLELKF